MGGIRQQENEDFRITDEMAKELEDHLIQIIKEKTSLEQEQTNHVFWDEFYVDYNDCAGNNDIIKWCRAKEPMETFLQSIDEWYEEGCYDLERDLLDTIKENWESPLGEYEEYEDFICDWVWEHVAYKLPEEHYLNQSVCVNIIVDTGDGKHDFVLNDVYPHYNGKYGDIVPEEASVLWLVRQQGFTKRQLNQALRQQQFNGSRLLESVRVEINNCTTHMNALAFFIEMDVRTLLHLQKLLNQRKKGRGFRTGKLILNKSAHCGLYDAWSGAGSVLEIELERDVELPLSLVDSILPDGGRGYAVSDIYGMCSSFWTPELKQVA